MLPSTHLSARREAALVAVAIGTYVRQLPPGLPTIGAGLKDNRRTIVARAWILGIVAIPITSSTFGEGVQR